MAGQGHNMPPANQVEKFKFSEGSIFSGYKFYGKHQSAEFLREEKNIRKILTQLNDIYMRYEKVKPGGSLAIEGMFLAPNVPLVLKKTNNSADLSESDVAQDDFTLRRLTGLVATYAYFKNFRYIYSGVAENLVCNSDSPHLTYLSALPGAEYFVHIFGYLPFLCALKRSQLKPLSEKCLLTIAYIQDDRMIPNIIRCARDFKCAEKTAKEDIGFDLKKAIETAPLSIKSVFIKHPKTRELFKTVCKPESE